MAPGRTAEAQIAGHALQVVPVDGEEDAAMDQGKHVNAPGLDPAEQFWVAAVELRHPPEEAGVVAPVVIKDKVLARPRDNLQEGCPDRRLVGRPVRPEAEPPAGVALDDQQADQVVPVRVGQAFNVQVGLDLGVREGLPLRDVDGILAEGQGLQRGVVAPAPGLDDPLHPARTESVGVLGDGKDALAVLFSDVLGGETAEQTQVVLLDGRRTALPAELALRTVLVQDQPGRRFPGL